MNWLLNFKMSLFFIVEWVVQLLFCLYYVFELIMSWYIVDVIIRDQGPDFLGKKENLHTFSKLIDKNSLPIIKS